MMCAQGSPSYSYPGQQLSWQQDKLFIILFWLLQGSWNHPNSQAAINTFPWKCLHLWLYCQPLLFHCNKAKNLPKAVNTFNFIYLQTKSCNWNCSIKSTESLILESIWQYYHYYAQFMVWCWVLQNSFLKPELFFLVVSNSFIPLLNLWLEKFQVIVLE